MRRPSENREEHGKPRPHTQTGPALWGTDRLQQNVALAFSTNRTLPDSRLRYPPTSPLWAPQAGAMRPPTLPGPTAGWWWAVRGQSVGSHVAWTVVSDTAVLQVVCLTRCRPEVLSHHPPRGERQRGRWRGPLRSPSGPGSEQPRARRQPLSSHRARTQLLSTRCWALTFRSCKHGHFL